jgi:DNA-directed RNA polymerase specialized sigma24 family protein
LLLSSDLGDAIVAEVVEMPEQADRRLGILAECVKRLGNEALDLLQRCYLDKTKIKDIATELGRSLAGTYQAMSRARREVFDCMQERLRREEKP